MPHRGMVLLLPDDDAWDTDEVVLEEANVWLLFVVLLGLVGDTDEVRVIVVVERMVADGAVVVMEE